MKLTENTRDRILEILLPILEPTRAQEGCLYIELLESLESGRLLLTQKWVDRTILTRYTRGDKFRSILIAADQLCEPPQLSLSYIAHEIEPTNIHELLDIFGYPNQDMGFWS